MDTATVAVVSSGLVGLAGVALAAYELRQRGELAQQDRQHQRQLANDERTYADRRDVYIELLQNAGRMGLVVERTAPIIGPKPPPPEWSFTSASTAP